MSLVGFVHSPTDRSVLKHIKRFNVVRTSPHAAWKVRPHVKSRMWIDGLVDGYENWKKPERRWKEYIDQFPGSQELGDPEFQLQPRRGVVEDFVASVLDSCNEGSARWISVPQLPVPADRSRNRINRELARAAGQWKAGSDFSGSLILPVILQKPTQVDKKGTRDIAVDLAAQAFQRAGAGGLWVVVMGLDDQSGSRLLTEKRFPGIVRLHQELSEQLPDATVHIGGPYWALNLVLWARGLISHPATGIGSGYQYQTPGARLRRGNVRIALTPFRRTAVLDAPLRQWLREAQKQLGNDDPNTHALSKIVARFDDFEADGDLARRQIADFLVGWYERLAATKPAGRALALYQELSEVFVLGRARKVPPLPIAGPGRRPERVAEQLMSLCLPET